MEQIYMNQKVSSKKTLEFLEKCTSGEFSEIHTIQLYKDNELMLRLALPPYENTQKRQLYSLSKSFTSTAIGFAWDDGILQLTDKITDIFECDNQTKNKFDCLTIHHLLSMNTGHEKCVMPEIAASADGIKAFFETKLKYQPGTHFAYNTGATYMLSQVITKLTGLTLFDYLFEKLWTPLSITPYQWQTSGGYINEGGIGLFLSCDDVVKLGLLYANKGVYEGKRLLSEEWVKLATSTQSDNSGNGTKDWTSGYGYQFWMNDKEGFRGDGAYGQYCIALPDKNIVAAAFTECSDMQRQLDEIVNYILDFEREEEEDSVELNGFIKERYMPKNSGMPIEVNGRYYLDKNLQSFTICNVKKDGEVICLELSNGACLQTIRLGNGKWEENEISAPAFKPVLVGLSPYLREDIAKFVASYHVERENVIAFKFRYINCPHKIGGTIAFEGEKIRIEITNFKVGTMYPDALVLTGKIDKK